MTAKMRLLLKQSEGDGKSTSIYFGSLTRANNNTDRPETMEPNLIIDQSSIGLDVLQGNGLTYADSIGVCTHNW